MESKRLNSCRQKIILEEKDFSEEMEFRRETRNLLTAGRVNTEVGMVTIGSQSFVSRLE